MNKSEKFWLIATIVTIIVGMGTNTLAGCLLILLFIWMLWVFRDL